MSIPKQVQKQSEEVQELYKQLNGVPEEVQAEAEASNEPVTEVVEAQSDSVKNEAPKSEAEEQGKTDTQGKETWEQKYKTLQGMYNADVPRLNAKNRDMQNRVAQLEQLLSTMNNQPKPQAAPVNNDPLITEADVKEYGDSIDVMRRAAREEVMPRMGGLHSWRQWFNRCKELYLRYSKCKLHRKHLVNKHFGTSSQAQSLIGKKLTITQTFRLGCWRWTPFQELLAKRI
jgi:hypothetical protein